MQRFEQQDLPLMFNRDVLKGKRILVTGAGRGLARRFPWGLQPMARTSSFAAAGRKFSIRQPAKFARARAVRPMRWSPTFVIPTA